MGWRRCDAILLAARRRVRPIMMTTLVAVLSAVPLAIGTGPGFELRQPLGVSIVGGLLASQLADALHDAGDLPADRPATVRRGRAPVWELKRERNSPCSRGCQEQPRPSATRAGRMALPPARASRIAMTVLS